MTDFYSQLRVMMSWLKRPGVIMNYEVLAKLRLIKSSLSPPGFDLIPGREYLELLERELDVEASIPVNIAQVYQLLEIVLDLPLTAATAAPASQEEIMSETTPKSPRDQLLRLIAVVHQVAQASRRPIEEQAGLQVQAQMLPSSALLGKLTEIEREAQQFLGVSQVPEPFTRLVETCRRAANVSEFNLDRGLKVLSDAVLAAAAVDRTPDPAPEPPVAVTTPSVSPRELSELITAALPGLQSALGADGYYDLDALLAHLGPVSTAAKAVLADMDRELPERFVDVMRRCFLELTVSDSDVTLGLAALSQALTEPAVS